jgi:hypothetical protein
VRPEAREESYAAGLAPAGSARFEHGGVG